MFALAIIVVVPALVLLVEMLADRAAPGWGSRLHNGVRVVLLSAIALQLLNELDLGATRYAGVDVPGWGLAFVAVIAALGLLELLRRSGGARMFLRFLAVAAPGALLISLASAPLTVPPKSPAVRAGRPGPIVMIVMDELPTTSLLKTPNRLDAERVPNFARLAREGTFYPNATTVADHTTAAVPAMLSGRRGPEDIARPDATNWPQNLFSLLDGQYRLDVREPITRLCPADACPAEGPSTPSAVGSLASEAPRLAFLTVAPNDLARRFPLLGGGDEQDPGDEVRDFLAKVRDEDGPTLDFLHVLTPHRPWGRLPSGRSYRPPGQDDVPESVRETLDLPRDRKLALDLWRAHLLQVGYADRLLGRVIEHLERSGMYDRTLLVVVADHGVSFRPGQPLRDVTPGNVANIASVPLFIKQPGGRARGTDPAPAQTIDVLPTILDVIEAQSPPGLEGRSLLSPLHRDGRVRVLSTRSAYVETTLPEMQAEHARWLHAQRRDVVGSEERVGKLRAAGQAARPRLDCGHGSGEPLSSCRLSRLAPTRHEGHRGPRRGCLLHGAPPRGRRTGRGFAARSRGPHARQPDGFLGPPRRPRRLRDFALAHPGVEQLDHAVHLSHPVHDRVHEAAGALILGGKLLGERHRELHVTEHHGVGQVVDLGRGVARGEQFDVLRARRGLGVERNCDLLDLAHEPLLAAAGHGDEGARRLGVHLEAVLLRTGDHPLGQLPRLRRGVLAHLSAGGLHGLGERCGRLAARDQHEHGVRRHRGQRGYERLQGRRLPGVDLLGEDVPRARGEREREHRRHHLIRRGGCRVEVLQRTRTVLGLGALAQAAAPLIDLGVVVAVDEVDGL